MVDESLDDILYGDSPRGVHGSLIVSNVVCASAVIRRTMEAPGTFDDAEDLVLAHD